MKNCQSGEMRGGRPISSMTVAMLAFTNVTFNKRI
jgi:hypothetical protein